jgi:hypothetical protein
LNGRQRRRTGCIARLAAAVLSIVPMGLGVSTPALAAERARATLVYARRDPEAARCPDEATFRALVGARIGYDPFEDGADLSLSVDFGRAGEELTARVRLGSRANGERGRRTLRSSEIDCAELSTSVALAVAMALDPEALRSQAPASPAPAEPSRPPEPKPSVIARPLEPRDRAERPAPRAPPGPGLGWRLDAGMAIGSGVVPGVTFGPRAAVALETRALSIGVEGAAALPGAETSSFGEVSASAVYGSLVPCAHPLSGAVRPELCLVGSLGARFAEAHSVTRSHPTTDVYAALGPRAAAQVAITESLGLRAFVELPVALSRVHLLIDDRGTEREVWASPSLAFLGGVSGSVRFR